MTQREEEDLIGDVAKIKTTVRDLYVAFTGSLDGKPGALHLIAQLVRTVENPENPERSVIRRLEILEDDKQQRKGSNNAVTVICSAASAIVVAAMVPFLEWLFGKK